MTSSPDVARPHWRRVLLLAALWLVVGLAWVAPTYFAYASAQEPIPWERLLPMALGWLIWAPLTPVVLWLSRRYRLELPLQPRNVLVHLGAVVACAGLDLLFYSGLRWAAVQIAGGPPRSYWELARLTGIQGGAAFDVVLYGAIVAVGSAYEYHRKFRDRELAASQLETRLMQAQLQVLKMQLHPHFLFNTLHSISALMHRDVDAADRMITLLSDLLRKSLENAGRQEVPLKDELEFLERYLEIETTRFSDRLTVRLDIDPRALDARVPNLILQPLVENAIKHGIALRSAPGQVDITARVQASTLRLEVQDNGPGLLGEAPVREGIGLSNTRVRLEQLYGDDHQFEVRNAARGGLVVRVLIPCHYEAAAEPPSTDRATPDREKTESRYASPGRR